MVLVVGNLDLAFAGDERVIPLHRWVRLQVAIPPCAIKLEGLLVVQSLSRSSWADIRNYRLLGLASVEVRELERFQLLTQPWSRLEVCDDGTL